MAWSCDGVFLTEWDVDEYLVGCGLCTIPQLEALLFGAELVGAEEGK